MIVQRIREAERDTVYNTYSAKLHDIVMGSVQRYEQRNMYVLLDNKNEALLPFSEQVPRENFRINDRIRAYVLDVRKTNKGPLVVLSRAAEGLVQRLIEFQVPEIQDDIVEIMAIAREPGSRTKVAVHSKRPEIDAVGACLGPKSSRIANVSDELRGEKIDVIRYAPDLQTFISNALAPAKVLAVELFEDDGIALVTVPDHQLSLAIGREGQNVRLAARLTGWRLDITSDSEAAEARARYLAEREAAAGRGLRRGTGRGGSRGRGGRRRDGVDDRRRIAAPARGIQAGAIRQRVMATPTRTCVGCRTRREQPHAAALRPARRRLGGRRGRGAARDAEFISAGTQCAGAVIKNKRFPGSRRVCDHALRTSGHTHERLRESAEAFSGQAELR